MARLYVGGLRDSLTRDDIEVTFKPHGAIKDVWIARNPPGFAFVEFEKKDDAERAIESLNNREVQGCTLKVQVASNKPKPGDRRPQTGRRSPPYRARYYDDRYDRYPYPPLHPYGSPLDYYDYYKYYSRPPPPPPRMYDRMYDRYDDSHRDYYGYERRYASPRSTGPPPRDLPPSQGSSSEGSHQQQSQASSAYPTGQGGGTGYSTATSYSGEPTNYPPPAASYEPSVGAGPPGSDLSDLHRMYVQEIHHPGLGSISLFFIPGLHRLTTMCSRKGFSIMYFRSSKVLNSLV